MFTKYADQYLSDWSITKMLNHAICGSQGITNRCKCLMYILFMYDGLESTHQCVFLVNNDNIYSK